METTIRGSCRWLSKLCTLFGYPRYSMCRIIIGTRKGTIILTTIHIGFRRMGKKMETTHLAFEAKGGQ